MPASDKRGKKRETVKEKLRQKEKECDKLKEHSIRLLADFENYQKHIAREHERFVKVANQGLIKDLLDIIDSLDKAIESLKEKDEESAEGFLMIYSNLMKTLKKHGLKPIESTGKKFDPNYHEILLHEESDEVEDTVIEELQKGYMLNNNVIRHSKVKTAK